MVGAPSERHMKPRHFALFVLAFLIAGAAHATTYTWTNLSGGSWGTGGVGGNWNGSTPTFLADDLLDFSTLNISADRVTSLDGDRIAGARTIGP